MILALALSARAGDLLHVGNSYTFFNDLELRTRALLSEMAPAEWSDGRTQRLADGGLRFTDHVSRTAQAGSAWEASLAGTDTWDWVILQEQSQIPGFPQRQAEFQDSLAAAGTLDDLVEARGAQTMFLLTWGRRDGDSGNAARFPDFSTMEGYLEEGYAAYRDATSTSARPTWIAPAGPAFARIHAAEIARGVDPRAAESRFARLYVEDGSHPSPLGTYLVACVVAGAITGETVLGRAPSPGVSSEDAAWLQEAAEATVHDGAMPYTYPWTSAQDTGTPEDTATPDDTAGPTDSGGARQDTASEDTAEAVNPVKDEGCGCATTPSRPQAGWMASLLAMATLAARRRPRR